MPFVKPYQVKGTQGYTFTRADGDGCGWVQPIQTQSGICWLSIMCRQRGYGGNTGLFEVALMVEEGGDFIDQENDTVIGFVTWPEMAAIINHLQGTSLEEIRAKIEESEGVYDLRQAAGLEG
jgi:hypothetical protein